MKSILKKYCIHILRVFFKYNLLHQFSLYIRIKTTTQVHIYARALTHTTGYLPDQERAATWAFLQGDPRQHRTEVSGWKGLMGYQGHMSSKPRRSSKWRTLPRLSMKTSLLVAKGKEKLYEKPLTWYYLTAKSDSNKQYVNISFAFLSHVMLSDRCSRKSILKVNYT